MDFLELLLSLAQSTLRFTPILIFAAMAGVFSERALSKYVDSTVLPEQLPPGRPASARG